MSTGSTTTLESTAPTNGTAPDSSQGHAIRHARRDRSRQRYFVYAPPTGGAGAPLLVVVHGLARDAQQYARSFAALCDAHGVVLVAPVFGEDARDYQRLGRSGRGPRADVALEAVLEEVVAETGAAAHPIYLFGHGAGAQFVHRFAMAYPHRVAGAVVACAGWYTFPNKRRRFPHGIRRSQDLPDVRFDAEEFLRIPIAVLVGEQETSSRDLRRGTRVDRQGKTRVERATNWVAAMRKAAETRHLTPLVNLTTIPGVENTFRSLLTVGRLPERVFDALFGSLEARND
jgi:pimeloyl-ACP methyl ester carboxylesterase